MEYTDRYLRALGASDPGRSARNGQADAAMAAAFAAAEEGSDIGALLVRVKYGGGLAGRPTDQGKAELGRQLRLLTEEVIRIGRARRWMSERTDWDAQAARKLYRTVAEHALAHWLDGQGGSAPAACTGGLVRERVRDMVGELDAIAERHLRLASRRLR